MGVGLNEEKKSVESLIRISRRKKDQSELFNCWLLFTLLFLKNVASFLSTNST